MTVAEDEAVLFTQELIRIDTSNTGDLETSIGEVRAAEYVAEKLAEVGIESRLFESAPRRTSVVARVPGEDPTRGALVIHGHLDVVPAVPADWKIHPFSGEIFDGYVWGRGAVDMKNMDAMVLAVIRDWARSNKKPPRDIVLAFFADEEAGGRYGAWSLAENHPELFDGCTEAIGEVGGYSITVAGDKRIYPIQTAEKGLAWTKLTSHGRAGHGSMVNNENAVAELADVVARLGRHEFPRRLTPTVREFLRVVGETLGMEVDFEKPEEIIAQLGPIAKLIGATTRTMITPTMLQAGYKANVIPGTAEAVVDARIIPGEEELFLAELDRILGTNVTREWVQYQPPVEAPFDVPIVHRMAEAIEAEDAAARVVPYMVSAGTDAKALSSLGIHCYGFSPLLLPAEFDFASMFHGVDERVPVEGLRFGVRTLDRFLTIC